MKETLIEEAYACVHRIEELLTQVDDKLRQEGQLISDQEEDWGLYSEGMGV